MTAELVEFLLACIAEDAVVAREAAEAIGNGEWGSGPRSVKSVTLAPVAADTAAPRHIAKWDPARVLAECESKRRLIRLAVDELLPNTLMGEATDEYGWTVLELLGLPFSDRPGYRQEWTP